MDRIEDLTCAGGRKVVSTSSRGHTCAHLPCDACVEGLQLVPRPPAALRLEALQGGVKLWRSNTVGGSSHRATCRSLGPIRRGWSSGPTPDAMTPYLRQTQAQSTSEGNYMMALAALARVMPGHLPHLHPCALSVRAVPLTAKPPRPRRTIAPLPYLHAVLQEADHQRRQRGGRHAAGVQRAAAGVAISLGLRQRPRGVLDAQHRAGVIEAGARPAQLRAQRCVRHPGQQAGPWGKTGWNNVGRGKKK